MVAPKSPHTLKVERLREVLDYDPATGAFTWRVTLSRRNVAGNVAGGILPIGYNYIAIDGRRYPAHRLAWMHVHGAWPVGQIDHKDTDRSNNRIANLRPATQSQNSANGKLRATNTSGFKGVSFDKRRGKWFAKITVDYHQMALGMFSTAQEAHAAYLRAANRNFGTFARAA